MSDEDSESKKPSGGRWWEFYVVRYFVGTVIGAGVVSFLNFAPESAFYQALLPKGSDLTKLEANLLLMLGAWGLTFCYVASAPVLVLHATRGVFMNSDIKSYRRSFYVVLVLAIVAMAFSVFLKDVRLGTILPVLLLSSALVLQAIPLYFSLKNEGEKSHDYYKNLTKARSNSSREAKEYVESYRHLREHGNAFFIVFFEFELGMLFFLIPKDHAAWAIAVVFIWIIPAIFVWFIGTALEYRYSMDYQPTPPKPKDVQLETQQAK